MAPALFFDLFDATHSADAPGGEVIERESLVGLLGGDHESLPRFLWSDEQRGVVFLAGHDRGEQVFMPQLRAVLLGADHPMTLVVVAGGLFDITSKPVSGRSEFVEQRREFYRELRWSGAVHALASSSPAKVPFNAVHIRTTDRSREAPTPRSIGAALKQLRRESEIDPLFIAADTSEGRDIWSAHAASLGFAPWSLPTVDFDRASISAEVSAAADWLLLSQSVSTIYPAASTFSSEATVASGGTGIALTAGSTTRVGRALKVHASNAWKRLIR